MYWGGVILVLTALREGRTKGCTAARLAQLFGVTRPTLRRWLRYFHEIFPTTVAWRLLSARLCPPVRPGAIGELIGRFVQARGDPQDALVSCLMALRAGILQPGSLRAAEPGSVPRKSCAAVRGKIRG